MDHMKTSCTGTSTTMALEMLTTKQEKVLEIPKIPTGSNGPKKGHLTSIRASRVPTAPVRKKTRGRHDSPLLQGDYLGPDAKNLSDGSSKDSNVLVLAFVIASNKVTATK